ncbi:MAG: methylthioribose-1-phosphate isomerase [Clostridiaceae bacterium BRH_c20a]|nr:MAG: methylthioribose-1-phosphate isomerase [Clostridiaceae bacterium BRH_c20a]
MDSVKYEKGKLLLLDQTKLPVQVVFLEYVDYLSVADAIRSMKVRGAPAIGVAAAYGVVLAAHQYKKLERIVFSNKMEEALNKLRETRPTAVNLFWALERMAKVLEANDLEVSEIVNRLEKEAILIQEEDLAMNIKMGFLGQKLLSPGVNILTHCNAGALATAGYGTALGVIRAAAKEGKVNMVYVDETRPLLQGSRLTAFELMEEGIPVTLITDNMAAFFMQQGKIDCVIVGADRITANGDVANKIGTYGVAVLANYHNIPFYVAAPSSTFDLSLQTGKDIPIEERNPDEIRKIGEVWIAPKKVNVLNPAFDVTPHQLITAIITDKGIIESDYKLNIKGMFF